MYVLLVTWVLAGLVSMILALSQCGTSVTKREAEQPVCGNGIVETEASPPEVCEPGDTISCTQLDPAPYIGGTALCNDDCLGWDVSGCILRDTCGNGVKEENEICEVGETIACANLDATAFVSGTASCDPYWCSWKTDHCVERNVCGNGVVEQENDEECDFADTSFIDCTMLDSEAYVGGIADCGYRCRWELTGCIPAHICGNWVVEDDEVCDGNVSCYLLDSERYLSGTALCAKDCASLDESGCVKRNACGNGAKEEGEVCELGSIRYCEFLDSDLYSGGTAYCKEDCSGWDTSTCVKNTKCGNGIIDDPSEECEKGQSFKCIEIDPVLYTGGDAPCNSECSGWDVAPCWKRNTCGNGLFEPGEECEREETIPCEEILPGQVYPGSAPCFPDCSGWDVAKCTEKDVCGNGIIEEGEACERGQKQGCAVLDPEKWGYGAASCLYDCSSWNTAECLPSAPEEEMISLPGGTFTMGCDQTTTSDCLTHEKPAHPVTLKPFSIDKTEVTVGAFAICVAAGACKGNTFSTFTGMSACNYGSGREVTLPMNCVSWEGARQYCAARGKRLPTEAEWEFAARSADKRSYPWGEQKPDCSRALFDECSASLPQTTGSLPTGASPYGLLDMAGNVREWVVDWYAYDYYWNSVKDDPTGPATGTQKVMRGGSYRSDARSLRTYSRYAVSPTWTYPEYGFRCAK